MARPWLMLLLVAGCNGSSRIGDIGVLADLFAGFDAAAAVDLNEGDTAVVDAGVDMAQHPWVLQNSGTLSMLDAVWGSGPNDVYVSGNNPPVILHSKNGGQTWDSLPTGGAAVPGFMTGATANDIYFGDSQNALAMHSKNGGMNWTGEGLAPLVDVEAMAVHGTNAWASGNAEIMNTGLGGLMHSNGLQGNWTWVSYPTAFTIQGIALFESNSLFVCADHGIILFSSDAGQTWAKQDSFTDEILVAIWGADSQELFSVGNHGTIVHTVNGGQNWSRQHGDIQQRELTGVWGSAANDVYAVYSDAQPRTILHSTDHGQTWNEEIPPLPDPRAELWAVWGSGPNDVYVVGALGTILHKQ